MKRFLNLFNSHIDTGMRKLALKHSFSQHSLSFSFGRVVARPSIFNPIYLNYFIIKSVWTQSEVCPHIYDIHNH